MVSPSQRALRSLLFAVGFCAVALAAVGCEVNSQACESNAECYTGERCVLQACIPEGEPDADTADVDLDANAPDADGPDSGDTDTQLSPPHPVAISVALTHSCALLSDATVWCWGSTG